MSIDTLRAAWERADARFQRARETLRQNPENPEAIEGFRSAYQSHADAFQRYVAARGPAPLPRKAVR